MSENKISVPSISDEKIGHIPEILSRANVSITKIGIIPEAAGIITSATRSALEGTRVRGGGIEKKT